jgi:hypothetical protein
MQTHPITSPIDFNTAIQRASAVPEELLGDNPSLEE